MISNDIQDYNDQQTGEDQQLCILLVREIDSNLTATECKIWHGAPVWFIDGNPIVGYDVLKNYVRLLFWSGQSFDEPGLQNEGKFKASEVRYTDVGQVNVGDLERWLKKSETVQWDYKNIVKHRGILERIS